MSEEPSDDDEVVEPIEPIEPSTNQNDRTDEILLDDEDDIQDDFEFIPKMDFRYLQLDL